MQRHHREFLALILSAALLLGLCPTAPAAQAATSSEIREQIDALEEEQASLGQEMADLESQMAENLTNMQQIVDQKSRLDQQVFLLNRQIDNINEQLSAYAVLIADKQDELTAAQDRLAELNEKNRERIRAMEENGKLSYWSVLFKANSFADFLDRLNMIEEIAAADQRRLDALREAARQVDAARQDLETERDNLQNARIQLTATQTTLADKRTQSDALLLQLQSRQVEYQQYLNESHAKENELHERLAQMEADYDRAAFLEWLATSEPPTTQPTTAPTSGVGDSGANTGDGEGSGGSSSGGDTEPSSGGGSNTGSGSAGYGSSGEWLYPLPFIAAVNDVFGWRDEHPVYGGGRMHYGVDLDADIGTPVYATRSGVVWLTDTEDGGAGIYVMLDHGDGYVSAYMHLSYYVVSEGEYVSAGQLIAYSGATGGVTGPHLHFAIMYNGEYINPMPFIT